MTFKEGRRASTLITLCNEAKMNARQMIRMIRRYNISLIYDNVAHLWWAGDAIVGSTYELGHKLEVHLEVKHARSQHIGHLPEIAVEDYCNARNLGWDV